MQKEKNTSENLHKEAFEANTLQWSDIPPDLLPEHTILRPLSPFTDPRG